MTIESAREISAEASARHPLPDTNLTVRILSYDDVTEAQIDEIIELLRRAYNGGPSWFGAAPPREHLRWKMAQAGDPANCAAVTLVEDDRDRILGFSLRVRHRVLVHGNETLVREGFDSCLDPELQGKRLSRARSAARKALDPTNGAWFSAGYGTHPTSSSRRGIGTSIPFGNPLDELMRPLHPRIFTGSRTRGPRSTQLEGTSRTRAAMERPRRLRDRLNRESLIFAARLAWSLAHPRPKPDASALRISTITSFDERIDAFWPRAAEAFEYIQVRDRQYLNWRFCDPRGGPYTVRLAEEAGQIVGYAVLRFAGRAAILEDLLTLPGRVDAARALAIDALTLAAGSNAYSLRCWMPHRHPYRGMLSDLGFVHYRTPMRFRYSPLLAPPEEITFLQSPDLKLHTMTSDTDHR